MTNRQVAKRDEPIEGEIVSTSLVKTLTDERRQILLTEIAPGISQIEAERFLDIARVNNVSPWTVPPQIWAVPRQQKLKDGSWITKYVPTMGIDGWRVLIQRTGMAEESVIEYCGMDGQWSDVWLDDNKPPIASRASVWMKGRERPQRFVCRFKEYAAYREGALTGLWRDKPAHMIGIRALSHCFKEVLRSIGGFTLEGIELGEYGGEDAEDERVAQRRFWAEAGNLGLDEPQVREALHAQDGQHLSERVEEMGGWARAQSLLEAGANPGERKRLRLAESTTSAEDFFQTIKDVGWTPADALRELAMSDFSIKTAEMVGGWARLSLMVRGAAAQIAHNAAVDATQPEIPQEQRATAADLYGRDDSESLQRRMESRPMSEQTAIMEDQSASIGAEISAHKQAQAALAPRTTPEPVGSYGDFRESIGAAHAAFRDMAESREDSIPGADEESPTEDAAEPQAQASSQDESLTMCAVCATRPMDGFIEDAPACQQCIDANATELAGILGPSIDIPPPSELSSVTNFKKAAFSRLSLQPTKLKAMLGDGWEQSFNADEAPMLWEKLVAPALPLG